MTAVTREGWIIFGFVALGVSSLTVCVAGMILMLRDRRSKKSSPE